MPLDLRGGCLFVWVGEVGEVGVLKLVSCGVLFRKYMEYSC